MIVEEQFASVIIDISHESVDRVFQYRIPQVMLGELKVGQQVEVPFGQGNRIRTGYVVDITSECEWDRTKLKELKGIAKDSVTVQSQLIRLAWWMKERYGSTMNQALKTVLPVQKRVKEAPRRSICSVPKGEALLEEVKKAEQKGYRARARLLKRLAVQDPLPLETAVKELQITQSVIKPMESQGLIRVEVTERYRNPLEDMKGLSAELDQKETPVLNPAQRRIADTFAADYMAGKRNTYLIHGITGSGKTEVYMEMIRTAAREGKASILLIPEISLTWQTVMRFYRQFGDRVSVLNSRMSAGERFDQYERARTGQIDLIIGPRSALFAPFENLGLIIIDEEHENAYKSELSPRYDAREAAAERAFLSSASLVLGSATPSLESYSRAVRGEYVLFELKERAISSASLPQTEIVDLREELKSGNRSIFSRRLQQLIRERLDRKEQSILFINRRGYANFVSCRSCGEAVKCPHCDVTLTLHNNGRMICHYCGYSVPKPSACPACGSPYIAPFGTGTQKIEEMAAKMFPGARILRMDLDTTSKKGGHQEILSAFSRGEADILIGTQMIVKGHDFPNVTLVGALAADLSLYASHYRSSEETFDLLTQAAGRAGRGRSSGNVVIQTYQPEHYSIQAAAKQDYLLFYRQEMAYRKMLSYPPAQGLLIMQLSGADEHLLEKLAAEVFSGIEGRRQQGVQIIGPVNAPIYKVNDIYRKILYIKQENYDILIKIRKWAEKLLEGQDQIFLQCDLR